MTVEERDRLAHVIRTFGFLDPLTVRKHPAMAGKMEIIDGENRWTVGIGEGLSEFPCWVIEADDAVARQLTPILNELHGTPDQDKLRELLTDLQERVGEERLREAMPFSRERFDEIMGQISVDWGALEQKRAAIEHGGEERWVERVYRMPLLVAEVVDQAIAKAKDEANAELDWQGLEFVCAEFMGR